MTPSDARGQLRRTGLGNQQAVSCVRETSALAIQAPDGTPGGQTKDMVAWGMDDGNGREILAAALGEQLDHLLRILDR